METIPSRSPVRSSRRMLTEPLTRCRAGAVASRARSVPWANYCLDEQSRQDVVVSESIVIYDRWMELRQLRYVEAVARHRHFTRAAEELHVAQSALSHQIKRIEGELGSELFERTSRRVTPTDAGEAGSSPAQRGAAPDWRWGSRTGHPIRAWWSASLLAGASP